jgi:hypothetical protein
MVGISIRASANPQCIIPRRKLAVQIRGRNTTDEGFRLVIAIRRLPIRGVASKPQPRIYRCSAAGLAGVKALARAGVVLT